MVTNYNDNTIILIDIEGRGVEGPIELQFDGELVIQENILSDWNGNGLSALIHIIPNKVGLNTTYPNPFNPSTSISYTLSDLGHVKLSIYNLAGQLIETLKNDYQNAGTHTLTWNASYQPSGMYFLRMETENELFHQKLMLLK